MSTLIRGAFYSRVEIVDTFLSFFFYLSIYLSSFGFASRVLLLPAEDQELARIPLSKPSGGERGERKGKKISLVGRWGSEVSLHSEHPQKELMQRRYRFALTSRSS